MDMPQDSYIGISVQSIKTTSQTNPFIIAEVGNDIHRLNQSTPENFPIAYNNAINYRVLNDQSIDLDQGKIDIWNSLNFYSEKDLGKEIKVSTKNKHKNSEVTLQISIFLSKKDIKKIFDMKKKYPNKSSNLHQKAKSENKENNLAIDIKNSQDENPTQIDASINETDNISKESKNNSGSCCENCSSSVKKCCTSFSSCVKECCTSFSSCVKKCWTSFSSCVKKCWTSFSSCVKKCCCCCGSKETSKKS